MRRRAHAQTGCQTHTRKERDGQRRSPCPRVNGSTLLRASSGARDRDGSRCQARRVSDTRAVRGAQRSGSHLRVTACLQLARGLWGKSEEKVHVGEEGPRVPPTGTPPRCTHVRRGRAASPACATDRPVRRRASVPSSDDHPRCWDSLPRLPGARTLGGTAPASPCVQLKRSPHHGRCWAPSTSSGHVTRKLSSVQRGPSLLLTGVGLKSPLDGPLDSLSRGKQ